MNICPRQFPLSTRNCLDAISKTVDGKMHDVNTKPKKTKSAEELAEIAFLDELCASDYEAELECPVVVVVKVASVRDVPTQGG